MPALADLNRWRLRFFALAPWNSWKNYIIIIVLILLLIRMLSFPYAKAQSNVKRSSLNPHDREHPGIADPVLSGDIAQDPCDKMLDGIAGGLGIPPCEVKEVKGVCVVRSCPEAGAVPDTVPDAGAYGAQDGEPPTEELAGTPTVDKASAWRPAQSAKDAGAVCTSEPCSSQADEKSV
jgi:hypothetical protein